MTRPRPRAAIICGLLALAATLGALYTTIH